MRVLIISHGHPAFSIGGAEIASHALFRAINATARPRGILSRPRWPRACAGMPTPR